MTNPDTSKQRLLRRPESRKDIETLIGGPIFSLPLRGPIREYDRLHKSLLMGELSNLVYLREELVARASAYFGFHRYRFIDNDGAQAFLFANDHDSVLVFRGTEPSDWNDIKADLNVASILAETVGHVHRGFKKEADDIWGDLEQILLANEKTLWMAGHSLGAAIATICAARCKLGRFQTQPIELYTFGSPRVGDHVFVNHTEVKHYRWVNNNDLVTRTPPTWLRYSHTGQEIYLGAEGRIEYISSWTRTKDLWRGFLRGLSLGRFDPFSDHLMENYIAHIHRAIIERNRIHAIDTNTIVV